MAEETPKTGAEGEDGYNAAREYRDYYERTQRFIMGDPEQRAPFSLEDNQSPRAN